MLRVAWPFKSVNSVLKVFFILHVFIRVIRLHQLEGGPVYNLLRFEFQENIINNFTLGIIASIKHFVYV